MNSENFVIMSPRATVPGSICIVGTVAQHEKIIRYQNSAKRLVYTVRAIIADHIALTGDLSQIVSAKPGCSIQLNENPLTIYLHHGEANAIFFDLRADDSPSLTHIDVEVETEVPLMAFPAARRAINELLDTLVRTTWMPLLIFRLDLLDPEGACVAHEVVTPFGVQVAMGPLGGVHQFPAFSALESLAREGICATSPYYRLLCAYRLYEGIGPLRKWLRETAEGIKVDAKLPKAVRVDTQLLEAMGFPEETCASIKTGDDLQRLLTDMRNAVAHFLVDGNSSQVFNPLHPSDGLTHMAVSMAAAALLVNGIQAVQDLYAYFQQHLQNHFHVGRLVLPLKENRARFRVVLPPYRSNPPNANGPAPGKEEG